MKCILVKRLVTGSVPPGQSYSTETYSFSNVSSVSLITETGVEKYSIVDGENTYKFTASQFMITVTA